MLDVTGTNLQDVVDELGNACGCTLRIVDGSVIVNGDYLSATAASEETRTSASQIRTDVVAKILVAPSPAGAKETWALLFFYINGARVAPPGAHHMRVRLEPSPGGAPRWIAVDWEDDEFGEWSDLERLDA